MFTQRKTNRDLAGAMLVFAFIVAAAPARGGSLDSPAAPAGTNSAMWTVEDIYRVLDTRTTNVVRRGDAFSGPTSGPTNGTMHTLNDIMALITNRAPVLKTWQKATVPLNPSPPGSDGVLQIGVGWSTPRFVTYSKGDNNEEVIRDTVTGLLWAKDTQMFGVLTNWTAAVELCHSLNTTGYGGCSTGWRLPNANELLSLVDYSRMTPCMPSGNPFVNVHMTTMYWTSTSLGDTQAYSLSLNTGDFYHKAKTDKLNVWPVCGGGR